MNAKFLSSVLSVFILLVWATFASAQNVLLFTFDDSGPNVTATVTGSFDTSGLNSAGQTAPRPADVIPDVTASFLTFGTTTATNIDLFDGANIFGGPVIFFPHLIGFPVSDQGGSIVTPLSEYLEINANLTGSDLTGKVNASIGLAEGETVFNADALANNVIVFQQSSLNELGSSSFLTSIPTTVLADPSGQNIIQFVAVTRAVILGDVNQDDVVNFGDIPPFIEVLSGGGFQAEADCNEDGAVDFSDIPVFIEILTAS